MSQIYKRGHGPGHPDPLFPGVCLFLHFFAQSEPADGTCELPSLVALHAWGLCPVGGGEDVQRKTQALGSVPSGIYRWCREDLRLLHPVL